MTGPVHVRGAQPGDVLQVDVLDFRFRQDWGFVAILPLLDEFTEYETIHPDSDVAKGVAVMPWGAELPLDPFFGILATAPPRAWGRVAPPVPRAFGNMDNRELEAGTSLYLPVFEPGAGFYARDGHTVQGDGEVCVTAWETGLTGTFRLSVRKDLGLRWPFAETPTGLHESLDEAMRQAVREMVRHVCARTEFLTRARGVRMRLRNGSTRSASRLATCGVRAPIREGASRSRPSRATSRHGTPRRD